MQPTLTPTLTATTAVLTSTVDGLCQIVDILVDNSGTPYTASGERMYCEDTTQLRGWGVHDGADLARWGIGACWSVSSAALAR